MHATNQASKQASDRAAIDTTRHACTYTSTLICKYMRACMQKVNAYPCHTIINSDTRRCDKEINYPIMHPLPLSTIR